MDRGGLDEGLEACCLSVSPGTATALHHRRPRELLLTGERRVHSSPPPTTPHLLLPPPPSLLPFLSLPVHIFLAYFTPLYKTRGYMKSQYWDSGERLMRNIKHRLVRVYRSTKKPSLNIQTPDTSQIHRTQNLRHHANRKKQARSFTCLHQMAIFVCFPSQPCVPLNIPRAAGIQFSDLLVTDF